MYATHAAEVPAEATRHAYREQIERAYPFHLMLIDALYTRWGSHPDFQRTRGVLRLLASIVDDLWRRRHGNTQTQHLIQPCHIRWSVDALQAAMTRYWGPAYQSVAAADIVGERSNAGMFDEERGGDYRVEAIGQGLAAATLLGSFGGQGGRGGFSANDLKLACSRLGLNWNYNDGALLQLENRCFYLHTTAAGTLGKRYWFGTKPTLNKLVVQYRQQMAKESFDEEILNDLRAESQKGSPAGATWRVIVNPGEDLPEQKALSLLVLPPSLAWDENGGSQDAVREHVKAIVNRCGGKDRIYRNTLLFLAGTSRGIAKLRQAYRERAALEGVRADYWSQLDEEQRTDLTKRLEAANQAVVEALGPAHTVALRLHDGDVETCVLSDARNGFQEQLGYLWTTLVEDEEWILRRVGSVTLKNVGLIPEEGGGRLKDAVESFLRFTDKPMIVSKDAVTAGLAQACADRLVGIGYGGSPSALQVRYCGRPVALDPSEDGVWIIAPFTPETDTDSGVEQRTVDVDGSRSVPASGAGSEKVGGAPMDVTTHPPEAQPRVRQVRCPGCRPGRELERVVPVFCWTGGAHEIEEAEARRPVRNGTPGGGGTERERPGVEDDEGGGAPAGAYSRDRGVSGT